MFSALSHWWQGELRSGRASRPPRRSRGVRPCLQALEDRRVLSTLLVTSNGDDPNVAGTLSYDVAHSQSGDVIQILPDPSQDGQGLHITLNHGELYLDHDLTIEAMGPRALIDGNDVSRVFEVDSQAHVTLQNLDITRGNSTASPTGYGGGILNHGELILRQCGVAACYHAKAGGGIYNDHGQVSVEDTSVSNNRAGAGGGIYNDHGQVNVADSTLYENFTKGEGGAIFNFGGRVAIDSSKLFYNVAQAGGAIGSDGGAVLLRSANVFSNHAKGNGGAINSRDTDLSLGINTYLQHNSAGRSGGGVFGDHSGVTVQNAFLLSNSAGLGGGGIDNESGDVRVTDSELIGNTADYGGGIDNSRGTVDITTTNLDGNRAKFNGGGIFNPDKGGVVWVTQSEFWGNHAGVTGGAMAGSMTPVCSSARPCSN
jgi:predicted outer membrane repeat protein